ARSGSLRVAAASCAATTVLTTVFFSGALPLAAAAGVAAANALAQSLRVPAHLSMVSSVASEHRGALLGFNATSNQAGYTLGAVTGGAILGLAGYPAAGLGASLASAAACTVYFAVALSQRRTERRQRPRVLPDPMA
ncbi:MAG: MFS transporter, partial [Chloroflexota bacterium]